MPTATATEPEHQKWALLIGIDEYQDSAHINRFDRAAADARSLKNSLIEACGFPATNVSLLVSDADPNASDTESKPLNSRISLAIARLARTVQPGDTVFIFFGGQGYTKADASYLLPYDADGQDENTLADTAIDAAKFRGRVQSIHAGLLILAFDICRNAPIKDVSGAIPTAAASAAKTFDRSQVKSLDFSDATIGADGPRAVVTLFSCSEGERSYESTEKGHGYFAYFLDLGLRGAKGATAADGTVRVNTLTTYLAQSVQAAAMHDQGKSQTPFVESKGRIEASRAVLNSRDDAATQLTEGHAAATAASASVLAADPHAYLELALTPATATVFIDGVRQHPIAGRVAVDLAGKPSKTVEVGVQAKGFVSHVESITVVHGTIFPLRSRESINITFQRSI